MRVNVYHEIEIEDRVPMHLQSRRPYHPEDITIPFPDLDAGARPKGKLKSSIYPFLNRPGSRWVEGCRAQIVDYIDRTIPILYLVRSAS